ncbi:MAG: flagellar assembly protein FliW [Sulfurimonas sp.]|uniref:flagellar assembly protein FliW n=1 Tax=Sulfurimonas sp. TaxID=2022749 RepID=UPI002617ED55|nr:flagellar assembly protein FliW [Sulfurimonas sp.]MDD2652466.1 flagellar assembly protein FliW [Sulfurimonas sp.]MDD3452203.1 flagellar assembly protein FliW [Sulfurimonas sp.]
MKFDICAPILGFEGVKQISLEKIDDNFMRMISAEDSNISFTLINPFALREYDFEIPNRTQELLGVDEKSNILVLNILLIQNPIEESLVNFIGPMVFNTDTQKAAQIILSESTKYGVAEKISVYLKK